MFMRSGVTRSVIVHSFLSVLLDTVPGGMEYTAGLPAHPFCPTMKKLAIGCLVVAVLACIVVGGVVYYAYNRVQSTLAQFGELSQIPEIESGIRVRDIFTPPASDELTARQVEQLLRVQTLLRERIGVTLYNLFKVLPIA